MKKLKLLNRFTFLRACVFICCALQCMSSKAQCTGSVPVHSINLPAVIGGSISGSYPLAGVKMCISPPCSTVGYFGGDPTVTGDEQWSCSGGNFTFTNQFDACKATICVPSGITITRVLICKPGAANTPLDVSSIGLPKTDVVVSDVVEGCTTTFNVTGAND